ncbi:glycoside hydrolase family 47 protein [Sphingomonas sp. HITSZ_GF]|uniref:glycoside hydrolase family 47 protein n=1 Tax=Sphingomonas sp. HITSZ_GF TaxID=3037247 RepID=UPI00240E0DCA|nr:glycoside hydrolase family 47 protein [Sphingomonas sp. HITSZ_GF]MDG2533558.1 glycoside hydrolase family 47 protein [Sphingomonas sp. HITSZ_GF]
MTSFRIGRRGLIAGSAAALLPLPASAAKEDWRKLADEVRESMRWAWQNYRERAWGKDQIMPVSGGAESFSIKGQHVGLSLIEALDTLWLMELDAEFKDGVDWIHANLSFDIDGEVSVFETIIRLVGGLLSAHLASGDKLLLAKAKDLTDRLMPAFTASPIGLPHRYVNLKTGAVRGPVTNPAEIGSCITEFGTLSRLTGDPRYFKAAKKAMVALFGRRSDIGLIPDAIDCMTGEWKSRRATIGPPSDSYYEYLWDGWQLLGDRDCLTMYKSCTAAILENQKAMLNGDLWFVDVDFETGKRINWEQDELSSFYGGLLAQGGEPVIGEAYTRSWDKVQAKYGILPEGYDPEKDAPTYKTNALRPELADAAFNHWLLDGKEEWRALVARHFRAMQQWNKAAYGYAVMADVTTKAQADHCPGYWWSEQMKYYWLIFADCRRFDYRKNYLSTEGNVLLGFRH